MLQIDPDYIEHFYNELMPMVHYVPASLENVTRVAAYVLAKENEEKMREIVRASNMWCQSKITEGGMARDMMLQLEKYQAAFGDYVSSNYNEPMVASITSDAVGDLDLVECN